MDDTDAERIANRRGWVLPALIFVGSVLLISAVWAGFGSLHQAVAGTQRGWDGDYLPTPTIVLTVLLPAGGLTGAILGSLWSRGRWRP
jgi:hypothetical protein